MTEILLRHAGGFIAGLLGACLIFGIFHILGQQKIATVDVTRIIREFVRNESAESFPPEKIKKDVQRFGRNLEGVMQHFARRHHLILVPREAVIAGTQDHTHAIQKIMQGESS